MTVARWPQNRSGREIAALAPLAASGCIILALTVAGPRVNAAFGSPGLVPLLITSGLATLVATKIARTAPMREGLAIVLGLALAMRLSIVFIEPILSTDVYRYVWDGRAAWRSDRSPEAAIHHIVGLLLAGLFLLSPNYPWYFLILVPFLPIVGGGPVWAFTVGAFLLYRECWCEDQPDILIWKTALNLCISDRRIVSDRTEPRRAWSTPEHLGMERPNSAAADVRSELQSFSKTLSVAVINRTSIQRSKSTRLSIGRRISSKRRRT
jgi:hypothetical protein